MVSVALDTAHIRCHQYGGTSDERRGLALCALRNKIFDLEAFTLTNERVLLVSDQAEGSAAVRDALLGIMRVSPLSVRVKRPSIRLPNSPDSSTLLRSGETTFWGRNPSQESRTGGGALTASTKS